MRDFLNSEIFGRALYEAYCKHTNWKSLASGQDLPQWLDLKPEIRKAWKVTADEAAKYDTAFYRVDP